MKPPLIPDLENPKWVIAQFILKAIGSGRAKKTASRLKIADVERLIGINIQVEVLKRECVVPSI